MDTAILKREALIAAACDAARNPYANAHVNAAHGNLIDVAIKTQPVAFEGHGGFPVPGSFESFAEYLKALTHALDEVAYQGARAANANAPNKIEAPVALFSNALHDSDLLGELSDAADSLSEDAREVA